MDFAAFFTKGRGGGVDRLTGAFAVVAVGASVAFAATHLPLPVAFVVVGGLCGWAVFGIGRTLPIAILATTCVEPQVLGGGSALAAQKGVAACLMIGAAGAFGLRRRTGAGLVLLALCLALLTSLALPGPLVGAGVSTSTILRGFVGYGFAWIAVAVRWERIGTKFVVRLLEILPVSILALGAFMQLVGLSRMLRVDGGVPRLQGSLIPAHLALVAFVGLAAALWDHFGLKNRRLGVVTCNLVILLATGTRGAAVAGTVMIVLILWSQRRNSTIVQRIAVVVVLVLAASAFVPILLLRTEVSDYKGTVGFNVSGRSTAWPFYWSQFEVSPVLGRGLGASSVAVEALSPRDVQEVFQAPHNTYLQLFVDGGLVVGGLVLASVGVVCLRSIRESANGRAVVRALWFAVCIYAIGDNLLATPQFMVPFAMLLGAVFSQNNVGAPSESPSVGPAGHLSHMAGADA